MDKPLFLLQEKLEDLLARQQVRLEGEQLSVKDSAIRYRLVPAVKVLSCETSSDDPYGFIDKYIPAHLLREAGAEVYVTSVTYHNHSYMVEQGFICNRFA